MSFFINKVNELLWPADSRDPLPELIPALRETKSLPGQTSPGWNRVGDSGRKIHP